MRKKVLLVSLFVCGLILSWNASGFAGFYTVDGKLNDWGVDLSDPAAMYRYYLDKNLPTGVWDIEYFTEDNTDFTPKSSKYVGQGYSKKNYYDAEAIYFDNDRNYAYIAIVTGIPQSGYGYWEFINLCYYNGQWIPCPNGSSSSNNSSRSVSPGPGDGPGVPYPYRYVHYLPGDIGIDINGDGVYEFGVDIATGQLYGGLTRYDWRRCTVYPGSSPWDIIDSPSKRLGSIPFVYSNLWQNSHFVIEAGIPLELLGLSAGPYDPIYPLSIYWTMECGNDFLKLYADVNPVPEPATFSLLGLGLWGLMRIRKRRRRV